jgi:hypothetical protein
MRAAPVDRVVSNAISIRVASSIGAPEGCRNESCLDIPSEMAYIEQYSIERTA